ncbi:hypothetical protein FQN54_003385 [Arachnomyces sp. PD_36]|nr:hypothetical protein FQN54_003385 [Arachnomyces sp. PD_36]
MPSHKSDRESEASLNRTNPFSKAGSSASGPSSTSHRRTTSLPGSSSSQSRQQYGTRTAESKPSDRHRSSRHRKRQSVVGPDMIDRLDNVAGFSYHHEGPYDATYRAKNISRRQGPVYALKHSTEEALKATPRDKIIDSLEGKRPLDGVAFFPPGTTDRDGQRYDYKEEYGMTNEDPGDYKPWPSTKIEEFKINPPYQRPWKRSSWGFGHRKKTL